MHPTTTSTTRRPSVGTSSPGPSRLRARAAMIVPIALAVAGCASLRGPVTRSSATLTCQQPIMFPVSETPARQTQGDISMLLTIETPECSRSVETSWADNSPGFFGRLTKFGPRKQHVRRTERDVLGLDRPGMTAIITITNQSERVFRGEGAVWTASVDGSAIPSEVGGMVGAVVPPGRDVPIRIDSIRVEADGGTYTFSLFDVPIQRNEAAETTQVGNFEWIYTLDHDPLTLSATTTTCDYSLTNEEMTELVRELVGAGQAGVLEFLDTRGGQFGDAKIMTPDEVEADSWRCGS